MPPETLPLGDATLLAHALTARLASDRGIRALSIKGPIAEAYDLRPPQVSADADVLVEPHRFEEFCVALERRGWHTRVGRATPALIRPHSVTYIHEDWPCDIDVHRMFPGFFADAAVAFDALWASHCRLTVAHEPVLAPSKAGAAVVMALHAARDQRSPRHLREQELVEEALIHSFTRIEREEFASIARAGAAVWVLRKIFEVADLGPVVVDVSDEDKRRWELFADRVDDASSVAWWQQIREASWVEKPRWIFRALWVTRQDMPRNEPGELPSIGDLWRYRFHRWGRGVEATLRYLQRSR